MMVYVCGGKLWSVVFVCDLIYGVGGINEVSVYLVEFWIGVGYIVFGFFFFGVNIFDDCGFLCRICVFVYFVLYFVFCIVFIYIDGGFEFELVWILIFLKMGMWFL